MTGAEARHPGIDAGIANPALRPAGPGFVMMGFSCYVLRQAPRHYPHQDFLMTARPERRSGVGTPPTACTTLARVAVGFWHESGIKRQFWR